MRIIKIRGKDLANGKWVYGDLLRIAGGCFIYFGSATETQTLDIPRESDVAVELMTNEVAVVMSETIGQFTELTDCNGKAIYEGDILSIRGASCEVVWNKEIASFCIRFYFEVYPGIKPLGEWLKEEQCGVIGNIYDNPELLKGCEM